MSLYDNFKDNAVYDGVMTELTAKLASRMSDYVKEHPEHKFNISQADLKKSDQIMICINNGRPFVAINEYLRFHTEHILSFTAHSAR